jgi:hypothetical protein
MHTTLSANKTAPAIPKIHTTSSRSFCLSNITRASVVLVPLLWLRARLIASAFNLPRDHGRGRGSSTGETCPKEDYRLD